MECRYPILNDLQVTLHFVCKGCSYCISWTLVHYWDCLRPLWTAKVITLILVWFWFYKTIISRCLYLSTDKYTVQNDAYNSTVNYATWITQSSFIRMSIRIESREKTLEQNSWALHEPSLQTCHKMKFLTWAEQLTLQGFHNNFLLFFPCFKKCFDRFKDSCSEDQHL